MQAFIGNAEKAAVNPVLVKQDFIPPSKTESPNRNEEHSSDFSRMVSAAQKSSSPADDKPRDVSDKPDSDSYGKSGAQETDYSPRKTSENSKNSAEKTEDASSQAETRNSSAADNAEIKDNKRLAKKDAKRTDNKKRTAKTQTHKAGDAEKAAEASLGTINLLMAQTEQAAKNAKPNAADDKNAGAKELIKLSAETDADKFSDEAEAALQGAQLLSFAAESKKTERGFASGAETSDGKAKRTEKKSSADGQAKITVTDLRAQRGDDVAAAAKKLSAKAELKTEIRYDGKNAAEMTVHLADGIQQNLTSSNSQTSSASSSTFQAMLANQIQNNAQDFVKAGNIVLKDNNAGQIKLILHPESLGNVKIDLEISDKTLSGRITVASQEAFNAFKESSESLRQAFVNSGFDNAGFELAMAGNGQFGGNLSGDGQGANDAGRDFAVNKAYSEQSIDSGIQNGDEGDFAFSQANSINIVA
ncbi:MAG: flagellar hook-length control protein FliK [Treponema sp.]